LWVWEQAAGISTVPGRVRFRPLPYRRSGRGKALDGRRKFDLTRFDETYFERLRSRVVAARKAHLYVAVMLFNGFSIERKGGEGANPWNAHPFNARNNVNGIDGDPQGRGDGHDLHTLQSPDITQLQEAYVAKVVDTLNDLDNVLWEIANESHAGSTAWQYHMIHFIRKYEGLKGRLHPVLMTAQYPDGDNRRLFDSPAEAVSPNSEGGYQDSPPAAVGNKIVISDTDHLWGLGGDVRWVWKTFLRGMHPVFMDPWSLSVSGLPRTVRSKIRINLGYTLDFADRMNLVGMSPRPDWSSSGYCLAEPGKEYLIYTETGQVTVDLSLGHGQFVAEWFDPATGTSTAGGAITGGGSLTFSAPFNDIAVLYLKRLES